MVPCLVVGDDYPRFYQIPQALILVPTVTSLPPWNIRADERHEFTKGNTVLTDLITKHLVCEKILFKRDFSEKGSFQIVRPVTAFINYIITDRLLRLVRFLNIHRGDTVLPALEDQPTPSTFESLWAFSVDSWKFNQALINQLAQNRISTASFEKNPDSAGENYENFDINYGFNAPFKNVKNPFPKRVLNALKRPNQIPAYLRKILHEKWPVRNPIPISFLFYSGNELDRKGFFSPRGRFKSVNFDLPPSSSPVNSDWRQAKSRATRELFRNSYMDFLRRFVDTSQVDEKILDNISSAFFNLLPKSFLEDVELKASFILDKFRAFGGKHYMSGSLSSSDKAVFYNFAAQKTT